MEYLTLQDIPHRHQNPMHSHRMASQPSERPTGNMAAAVCEYSHLIEPPSDSPALFLPPILNRKHYDYASYSKSEVGTATSRSLPNLPLHHIDLPVLAEVPCSRPASPHRRLEDDLFRFSLEADMSPTIPKHSPIKPNYASYASTACSPSARKRYNAWCDAKTAIQNHLQRNSPPLQPGEQNFPGKLPSFDEVGST